MLRRAMHSPITLCHTPHPQYSVTGDMHAGKMDGVVMLGDLHPCPFSLFLRLCWQELFNIDLLSNDIILAEFKSQLLSPINLTVWVNIKFSNLSCSGLHVVGIL